ncbi:predicted protein [Lichtheimia corymbifera JMRC:FSU:9682]|uniref:Uncharacterized protein n=1 Tax=Lichtheimia corymbifera JMRC:FSU:9682 TaxID=1263082 RepID=A0A068S190_9FUNG|nr:predicted protein [Lichtheimia corymbifera JMRC:FSU:9682]
MDDRSRLLTLHASKINFHGSFLFDIDFGYNDDGDHRMHNTGTSWSSLDLADNSCRSLNTLLLLLGSITTVADLIAAAIVRERVIQAILYGYQSTADRSPNNATSSIATSGIGTLTISVANVSLDSYGKMTRLYGNRHNGTKPNNDHLERA